jgi:RNA polymerase sigma-70 factor, ECF subfamily
MEAVASCEAPMADSRDDEVLAQAYQHFSRRVYLLCRYLLGSSDAARDATNEVFLRAHQAKEQFNREQPVEGWLLSIARNYSVDQLRRRTTEQRVFSSSAESLPEPATAGLSPLGELLAIERKAAFRRALEQLSGQARKVIDLRYEREMSYQAIAEDLGVSRNEVGVLLFRAKEQLRRILQGERKEPMR